MYTLILITIVLIIYYFWKDKPDVPHPYSLPFIGNIHLFIFNKKLFTGKLPKLFDNKVGIMQLTLGLKRSYYVENPEFLQILMNDPNVLNKAELYDIIRQMMGDGLVSVNQPFWKIIRRTMQTRFSQRHLNNLVEIMMEKADELVDVLKKYTDGQMHDLTLPIHVCNIKTICGTQFGVDVSTETAVMIFESVHNVNYLFYHWTINFLLRYKWIFYWTKYYQLKLNWTKNIDIIQNIVVQQKIKDRSLNKDRESLIDLLMDLVENNKLDSTQIYSQFNVVLVAGYDTTAKTATFLFITLGLHQDIQDKVYEEIMEILGDNRLDFKDLSNFKYTERVIKETLRLFPVAHTVSRHLPYDINLGKYKLPGDSTVYLGLFSVQRSPFYWDDPLKFDPDRFLPENMKDRHPYTFVPFSGGPRNCIGATYSIMSLKCIIISVIKNYRIRTTYKNIEDIDVAEEIFLTLTDGTKTILESRN